ncbi:hypothetical protein RYR26_002513, partial [Flavobacterium psychrophilum]|nr:hypothetical protein [Flavobacterium psychrophilum]
MAILFGIRERGIIKTYKKQFITTELTYAIIPLSFGESYLNNGNKQILLKRNKLSILVSVLRAIINLIFCFSLLLLIHIFTNEEFNFLSILFFSTIFILFVWINFFLGKSNNEENKVRECFFN